MSEIFKEFQKEVRGTLEILLWIFIVLKLTNLIDWSWVWVLAPFWIPGCLAVVGILIYLIVLIYLKKVKSLKQ